MNCHAQIGPRLEQLERVMSDVASIPDDCVDDGAERYSAGDLIAKKYELVRRLGRGGMGEVWLARNRALDAEVALKLISHAVDGDPATRKSLAERLLEEARATAQLQHPAVVRVFDFGITRKGDPMIVMEYLQGQNLHAAVTDVGRPSPLRAVRIMLPVIHGLCAVHAKGVVHRDVKPENIVLCQTESGQVQPKLVDFGIARRASRQSSRLTMAGTVIGSPEYMSPEQARGEEAGAASDIWGICVVLYELVTGDLPFPGDDITTLLYRIIHDDPLPVTDVAGAEGLWPIIQRGLSKSPAERYPDMRALGQALADWTIDQGAREDITGASIEAAWADTPSSASHALLSIPPPPTSRRGTGSARVSVSGVARRADSSADLSMLADLHQGGDPVRLMERAARRRVIGLLLFFVMFGTSIALAIVVSVTR